MATPGSGVEPFGEEHQALRVAVRRWLEVEVTPHVAAWEASDGVPAAVLRQAADLGYRDLSVGADEPADPWAAVVWQEELGRAADGAVADALGIDEPAVPPWEELLAGGGGWAAVPAAARRRWVALAARCVGAAQGLVDDAVAYARQREAFGRPIGAFQVQRHRLAELVTRVEATRRLVHAAVARRRPVEVTAAALLAGELLVWVADEVLQLHGGFGYAEASGIPRRWRTARAARTGGAPTHLQREVLADLVAAGEAVDDGWLDLAGHHVAFQAGCRAFVAEQVAPHVERWEATGEVERDLFRRVGAAGLFGMKFAPRWGGTGPDLVAQAVWIAELARAGAGGVAADLGAHADLAALYVDRAGDDAQRERWLVPSIAGELIGGLAITEPDAGSDVAGIRTTARRDGDGWVIDGAKTYITNGSWADYLVVACRTGEGHGGLTLFVVPTGVPGVTRRRLRMLGWRTSHTGELAFAGVVVGDDHRLGPEGSGFAAIMRNFAWERLTMALGAVAATEVALQAAVDHARHRRVGGRPLAGQQVWRHRVADLAAELARGRALTAHALRVTVAEEAAAAAGGSPGRDAAVAAAQAKLVTQRLAVAAAELAVAVHGDEASAAAETARRWLRDARLGPIGGGTDEIMREIIGRTVAG